MTIVLERETKLPLYIQVKNRITELIHNGTLKANSKLPATRELAASLGISRNVVISAYQELEAEGLISSSIGRGTFVSRSAYAAKHGNTEHQSSKMSYEGLFSTGWAKYFSEAFTSLENLKQLKSDKDFISFDPELADFFFSDINNFKKSLNAALVSSGSALLSSNSPQGFEPLLEYLSEFLSLRGISCGKENILIVNGTQQGLSIVGRLFIDPGDTILLENLTYPGALTIFRSLQTNCIGVPVNNNGINLNILENVLRRRKAKLLYTIPTFHNPLGSILPAEKRDELLQMCRENQVIIIEDDYAHELSFNGRETAPLKARDEGEGVIYMGSFSETLFPGIRLSWIVASSEIIKKLTLIKKSSDLYTNPILQAAVLEYCRKGFLGKLIKKKVLGFKKKSNAMQKAMELYFPQEASWDKPEGGLYQWVDIPSSIDSLALLLNTREKNVIFSPDRFFSVEEWEKSGFRLSFAAADEEQIWEGIKVIGDELKKMIYKR
ncbi:MAG: PLP-dependent aminotransferase family protein [Spirochaetales bacterium]|nr:PLP-dependent aminotransferase family protein [Spirochaetales bacterium]